MSHFQVAFCHSRAEMSFDLHESEGDVHKNGFALRPVSTQANENAEMVLLFTECKLLIIFPFLWHNMLATECRVQGLGCLDLVHWTPL